MSRPNYIVVAALTVAAFAPGAVAADAAAPVRSGTDAVGGADRTARADHGHHRRHVPGEVRVASRYGFDETWARLVAALDANPAIRIVATVDHAAAAATAGLDLDPNRVVVFGNPNLGTPLMQANQTAGIDLPQKIHVTERRGRVTVSYNSPSYLVARHALGDVATVDTIAGALASFAEAAAGRAPHPPRRGHGWLHRFDGLDTTVSHADFETTWSRLLAAIDASPATVAFTVDHGANAAANGLDLRPTRLVVFGNPNLGTPLMQARPSAGIDLPLKILVWEDAAGTVRVTTNSVEFLAARHHIVRPRAVIDTLHTIEAALDAFVAAATA